MNDELATHISQLAAPIYALFLFEMAAEQKTAIRKFPEDIMRALQELAVEHAYALWLAARNRDK